MDDLTRRRFLVAAITCTGAALGGASAVLGAAAWASSGLNADTRDALSRVARTLYPHSALGDDIYADVLDQAMAMVADDRAFESLLNDAERALQRSDSTRFLDASAEAQAAALKSIEGQTYFAAILGAVANRLYSHPKTWELLGYEGPSFEKGGYIDRGSGDIDWLPEVES